MIDTGFVDKNERHLFVGDKIRVPDNPDIVPWDEGTIIELRHLFDESCKFIFLGRVGIFPLSCYKSCEIEKLNED